MPRPLLGQIVDVLQGLWALDEAVVFESESGSRALLAMESYLLEWIESAPEWMFDPQGRSPAEECEELPGQEVLPLGDRGGER